MEKRESLSGEDRVRQERGGARCEPQPRWSGGAARTHTTFDAPDPPRTKGEPHEWSERLLELEARAFSLRSELFCC